MVECGQDVVILLDSMTRLARAHNMTAPHSGRTLSGGLDAMAIVEPRRFLWCCTQIRGRGKSYHPRFRTC